MIRINLATRKQAVALAPDPKRSGVLSVGGKAIDTGLGGLKELPIKKFALAAAAIFLASYLLDDYKQGELAKANQAIELLSQEKSKLQAELGKTKRYEELKKALEADEATLRSKIETIQTLLAGRQVPPKVMINLSGLTPANVWLKQLSMDEKQLKIQGSSLEIGAVSDYIKALGESAYFKDVRLEGTRQEHDSAGVDVAAFDLVVQRR